jgi:hypothetical protein
MAKGPAAGIITYMAIIENRSYFDTLDDEVSRLIAEINPSDNQFIYRKSKKRLEAYVLRHRGEMFRFRKEALSLVGSNDSVLIKVGPAKRGHLAAYRGHWVRVIWYGTYGFSMDCLVHKVKMPKNQEPQLILRGPYTKDEFTDALKNFYPFNSVSVDGQILIRSIKGNWISSIPTDKALDNLEKDEFPDWVRYYRPIKQEGDSYTRMVEYRKFAGVWIKTHVTREDVTSGRLDWIPVGGRVYVDRSGDIPSGWNVRTSEGWKAEG